MAWATPVDFNSGDLVTAAGWQTNTIDNPNALLPSALEYIIDGGGSTIPTGIAHPGLEIPFKCDITRVTMWGDVSGSAVVDIWVDTYANFPPTNADSITASAVPTLSSAVKSQDTTLTGWTKALASGSIMFFNVDSATSITKLMISLKVDRS